MFRSWRYRWSHLSRASINKTIFCRKKIYIKIKTLTDLLFSHLFPQPARTPRWASVLPPPTLSPFSPPPAVIEALRSCRGSASFPSAHINSVRTQTGDCTNRDPTTQTSITQTWTTPLLQPSICLSLPFQPTAAVSCCSVFHCLVLLFLLPSAHVTVHSHFC